MIIDYFGKENIKLIEEKAVFPDRPDRYNEVGLSIDFLLNEDLLFGCDIGMGVGFTILAYKQEKIIIAESKYLTHELLESLDFDLIDKVVLEKLEILSGVIDQIRNGEEVTKVDIKVSK